MNIKMVKLFILFIKYIPRARTGGDGAGVLVPNSSFKSELASDCWISIYRYI